MLYTQCPRHKVPCSEETLRRLLYDFHNGVRCPAPVGQGECNDECYVTFQDTRLYYGHFLETLAFLVGGMIQEHETKEKR